MLPASALALSTALLTANRTEELRARGGSPTANKNRSLTNENTHLVEWFNTPFDPSTPMGLGASLSNST